MINWIWLLGWSSSMKNKWIQIFLLFFLIIAYCNSITYAEDTQTITDMIGRTVVIPSEIKSVLCGSPPAFTLTYTIAPEKLAGLTIGLNKKYTPGEYLDLPVVGTIGTGANFETFLDIFPDIILMSNYPVYADEAAAREAITMLQEKLQPIPIVFITEGTNITEYSDSIRFVGDLLNEKEQSDVMIEFYENILKMVQEKVASIPENERVSVYYAGDNDGLSTIPYGSDFSLLIEICGGINVANFGMPLNTKSQSVSIEQVMNWNPDVILVLEPEFYDKIKIDPGWQEINAVKKNRVYLIPETTYNWFTRPPGLNRIIGIPWTAKTLYPDYFADMDLENLIQLYHKIFLHISLSNNQLQEILNP